MKNARKIKMMLSIYNTLTRKKESFEPKKGKRVSMFVCGPTVYDLSHLGHARTYVVFDMIARYFRILGYDVFYLQNITDLDDRIIQRAREEKKKPEELAEFFEKKYYEDMELLGIDGITKYAPATDFIKEIQSQVKRLIDQGLAYELGDGIYYDISKFKNYGKLSRRTILQAEDAVSRIDEGISKKHKGDFCLWKFSPPAGEPGEPEWSSPWGPGRPGWHIEDTAITESFFGPQYDVHGGGRDLSFPHHEAEIAQMEGISGKSPMVKYWIHTGFVTIGGRKMAKSLGNFITIQDFIKKFSPRILRFLILKTHYRSPLDYTEKIVVQTKGQLQRMDEFVDKLERKSKSPNKEKKSKPIGDLIEKTRQKFNEAMQDDFNTPKALAAIFAFIKDCNSLLAKGDLSESDAKEGLALFKTADKTLGFIFRGKTKTVKISASVKTLAREREKARLAGNWQRADELRKEIQGLGYKIEDTGEGTVIKKFDSD